MGGAARPPIRNRSGVAIVAMDPWTGRVLTIGNPQSGLFTAYQPCSVFKLVVAVAGLAEGVITPETRYTCNHGCWLASGHGPIDLGRALAVGGVFVVQVMARFEILRLRIPTEWLYCAGIRTGPGTSPYSPRLLYLPAPMRESLSEMPCQIVPETRVSS